MRAVFFLLTAVTLVACSDTNRVPAGIIPGKKMEAIMWQLMQSDEYVNRLLTKDSLKKSSIERMKIYQQVFELNGTSLADFRKSYAYYMEHPGMAKVMFDSIGVRAARQRMEQNKPKPVLTSKPAAKS